MLGAVASKPGDAPKVGDVIEGRYRILGVLGEGGMGTVFLAEHTLIKRRVAIKVLHPDLATDADVIERFMNEARAAGTLGHPNIVESTDMGFTGAHVPYIAFEHLEGVLLTSEIYRVGGMPVRRAVRICAQIASALDAAHHAGVVHRDLKSDNVFLTDKDDALDHVKVLDFGISRFLEVEDRQKGMVIGTPEFMAPEQITDPEHVDGRADIYALGVILYEMLTARRPFSTEADPQQLLHRIVNEAPPPLARPEIPHGLGEIILNKLMAKRPDDRYQTMADVLAALDSFTTNVVGADDAAAASAARKSGSIPKPAKAVAQTVKTPWPGSVKPVMLPSVTSPSPRTLYAIAAGGVIVGALGLGAGFLRGGGEAPAPAPAPVAPAPVAPKPATLAVPLGQKIAVELDADVPGAKVTFRRRVDQVPVVMQLSPTDIVERVEISAPGYKTERFWLTFDRPTHLQAHLVKGDGTAEATDDETSLATSVAAQK